MSQLSNKLVVWDFDIPQLFNNKLFIPEEAIKVSHTTLPTCYLYKVAQARGIQLITQDVFFKLGYMPKNTLLVSHLITPYTKELLAAGVRPAILTCQESPFIASRFYVNFRKYSSWFPHAMVFGGMKKMLSTRTRYHQMFFPVHYSVANFHTRGFHDRKFSTMVVSNKQVSNWKKDLVLKLLYGLDVRTIYKERMQVIEAAGPKQLLDIYGAGWEKGAGDARVDAYIRTAYKGRCEDKVASVAQYKFYFAFENSVFPGYVTEKIIDGMIAGAVPIYLGAPDITNFIPSDCFIDMRQFKNAHALFAFLQAMSESDWLGYQHRIQAFFASPAFQQFSQEQFAHTVLTILEHEWQK
jgi:hypothetical protein